MDSRSGFEDAATRSFVSMAVLYIELKCMSIEKLRTGNFKVNVHRVPENSIQAKPVATPLWLLVRVNVLHSWRRLLAVREQSRLLTSVIALFLAGYLFLSFELFFHGMKFIAKFPGLGAVLTERLMYALF